MKGSDLLVEQARSAADRRLGGSIGKRTSRGSVKKARRVAMAWGYILILPNLLGLLVFYIWPIFQNLYLSLTRSQTFGAQIFVGLANYWQLLHDDDTLRSFLNTVLYAVMTVPIMIAVSVLLATLVNRKTRISGVYRVILLLPAITMPAAVGMIWRWLFNSDYGLINQLLVGMGLPSVNWLGGSMALVSVAIVGVWSGIGYCIIVLLGGLQTIDSSFYEAAALDGAGPVRIFFSVTLPLLTPSVFFLTVTSLISAFQVFDLVYLMVGVGSPAIEETRTAVYSVYEQSFINGDKGYGAAVAVVLFLGILVVTIVQMRLQKKWVFYA